MELINAVTCNIRTTERFIYSTECRTYLTTKYQIHYSKRSWLCTVFDTREQAERELALERQTGWVEPMAYEYHETLHHRYKREGR